MARGPRRVGSSRPGVRSGTVKVGAQERAWGETRRSFPDDSLPEKQLRGGTTQRETLPKSDGTFQRSVGRRRQSASGRAMGRVDVLRYRGLTSPAWLDGADSVTKTRAAACSRCQSAGANAVAFGTAVLAWRRSNADGLTCPANQIAAANRVRSAVIVMECNATQSQR